MSLSPFRATQSRVSASSASKQAGQGKPHRRGFCLKLNSQKKAIAI